MKRQALARLLVLAWALGACAAPVHAQAQPGPTAREIIERLAPPTERAAAAPPGSASTPATAGPALGAAPQGEPGAAASAASPAPAARLRNLRVAPRRVIDLNVPFEFDSAVLRPESEATLQQLGLAMQSEALRDMRFLVEGHTDAKGAAAYNERLSGLRARAVADYLVRQGVEGARLQAVGKGSRELLPSEPPLSPAHRRVRIVALD